MLTEREYNQIFDYSLRISRAANLMIDISDEEESKSETIIKIKEKLSEINTCTSLVAQFIATIK